MTAFVWTEVTGWLAVLLFCSAIAIPYLVVRRSASASRPHIWLGFAVLGLALVHTMAPGGAMRGADPSGLVAATAALFGLVGQIVMGAALRHSVGAGRRRDRRVHFWTMAALAVLIGCHVILNRAP